MTAFLIFSRSSAGISRRTWHLP